MGRAMNADETKFLLNDIPAALRRLRKQEGLTLVVLSERCGLSVSHLSDIERGRTKPSLDSLNAIVAAYDKRVTLRIENSTVVFSMFGHLEVEVLYALEKKEFARVLSLIAALMGHDDDEGR
jgi:transcriptional regulator with XRE-family HTH domain